MTAEPFGIGAPHVWRRPRGDTGVIPEAMSRPKAQRANEAELRRSAFNPVADNDTDDTDATPH